MALNGYQKNYIKKNIRQLPVSKIASDLGLFENEVLDYLKKKWSPEKYDNFLLSRVEPESPRSQAAASFSFSDFLQKNRVILAVLALLVFAVYFNSLGNGFVSDDILGVAKNESIGNIGAVFSSPMAFVQRIAYFIAHDIGENPGYYRFFNILFHLGSTFLVFTILSIISKRNVAIFAAVIFAVHPVLTESITWISGIAYTIYSFFFLLSFLFYLLSPSSRKYYYYSIAFYVLSLLSSEKAVVLFLVFALYEISFGRLKLNWKKLWPYFAASAVFIAVYLAQIGTRESSIASESYAGSGGGLYNPLIQIPVAIGSYLKLIFWPARLTLYQTEMSFSQGQYFLYLLSLLAYIGAAVWSYFKNKTIFFWLAFFLITLLPVLTPLKISWIVAERYAYLGTVGIIVVVAMLFDRFLSLKNENAKMAGYFVLTLIVASLSVRTVIRNRDWKSEDTLWVATAQVAPSGQQIHNNLGDVYARQKDYGKAIEEFQKAIEINPNYADAYHNLGNTYQTVGENDKAMENYQKAASINPNLWQSYQNMAAIYFNAGDYQKALENIKKAAEINPTDENLKQNVEIIQSKLEGQ